MRYLLMVLLLWAPSLAQPISLEHLLKVEQQCWAPAWVSSGFDDWRTVSKYRRKAGLHLGYDIAMPYGSPVAAAWPGTVVAVTPWTSTEYGVTVSSGEGWEVTYGHVAPNVAVGAAVNSGTVIGTIASDHVDVKMRDAHGAYVAFDREQPTRKKKTPAQLLSDYRKHSLEAEKLRKELEQRRVIALQGSPLARRLKRGRALAEKGLISRRELASLKEAARLEAAQSENPGLQELIKKHQQILTKLVEVEREAAERDIGLPVTDGRGSPTAFNGVSP